MYLTPELVAAFKNKLTIDKDFEPAEKDTASHVLYKEWKAFTGYDGIPKLIFYILMDEIYGPTGEVDESGCLGRKLKLKPKENQ